MRLFVCSLTTVCLIPVQGYSTIALPLVPEFQGQRKIKEKGGEKKI